MTEHDTQNCFPQGDKSSPSDVSSTTGTFKLINLAEARLGLSEKASVRPTPFGDTSKGLPNLVRPDLANWYRETMHQMTASVVKRHYVDLENQLAAYENGKLPLSEADRLEIKRAITVLAERLDDITPHFAATIEDHDTLRGNKTREVWPDHLDQTSLLIHFHFCELIHAWNLNPFKRDMGVAAVDESAEENGVSRFSFTSKESRDDFLDYYALDDFVLDKVDAPRSGSFFFLVLTNKFSREDAQAFFDVYKEAMNSLSVIYEEQTRAVRHDGGKLGFLCADHFSLREQNELNKIKLARQKLGAGEIER